MNTPLYILSSEFAVHTIVEHLNQEEDTFAMCKNHRTNGCLRRGHSVDRYRPLIPPQG